MHRWYAKISLKFSFSFQLHVWCINLMNQQSVHLSTSKLSALTNPGVQMKSQTIELDLVAKVSWMSEHQISQIDLYTSFEVLNGILQSAMLRSTFTTVPKKHVGGAVWTTTTSSLPALWPQQPETRVGNSIGGFFYLLRLSLYMVLYDAICNLHCMLITRSINPISKKKWQAETVGVYNWMFFVLFQKRTKAKSFQRRRTKQFGFWCNPTSFTMCFSFSGDIRHTSSLPKIGQPFAHVLRLQLPQDKGDRNWLGHSWSPNKIS